MALQVSAQGQRSSPKAELNGMIEAIKNAIVLVIFCAPIAAVFTWLVWWNGESIFFVLLLLGLLSGLWVLGYLSERAAA